MPAKDETPDETTPPAMPGPAGAPMSPDETVSELEEASHPRKLGSDAPATSIVDSLFRAGTLRYTSAGIAILFFWLLWGDFALYMRERSVGPTVQLFLKSLHASDTTMSLLVASLPPAIALILSPMISYRSDRLRSRWGRRIPYLLIPTPFAAGAMAVIAYSRELGTYLQSFVNAMVPVAAATTQAAATQALAATQAATTQAAAGYLNHDQATLIVFAIAWTVFEVAAIASGAVFAGLINDVVPRGRLGRFYGLFRAVSLADGIIFNKFLLQYAESHFTALFLFIAAVFGIGFTMMCLMVKEGEYPPPEANAAHDHRAGGFVNAVKLYARDCFSKPHYLWCFATMTLGAMAFLPINNFSIPWAKQLNMDMKHYGDLVGNSYIVSLCLAYPLGWLVDRYHALRMSIVTLAIYAFAALFGMLFVRDVDTFGIAIVVHTILSGTYFTASASLALALLPRSNFAQFAAAGGIVTSVTQMVVAPVVARVLDTSGSNYRLTFVAGLALTLAALATMLVVYRRFMRLGGPGGYVAPGDEFVEGAKPTAVAGH